MGLASQATVGNGHAGGVVVGFEIELKSEYGSQLEWELQPDEGSRC